MVKTYRIYISRNILKRQTMTTPYFEIFNTDFNDAKWSCSLADRMNIADVHNLRSCKDVSTVSYSLAYTHLEIYQ